LQQSGDLALLILMADGQLGLEGPESLHAVATQKAALARTLPDEAAATRINEIDDRYSEVRVEDGRRITLPGVALLHLRPSDDGAVFVVRLPRRIEIWNRTFRDAHRGAHLEGVE
jgi:hypothetical protein